MTEDDKYKSIYLRKGAEEVLKKRPTELQRLTGILEYLGVFHNSANQVLWVNMPPSAPGPRVLPLRSPLLRAWLFEEYRQLFNTPPKQHNLLLAVRDIESRALYANPEITTFRTTPNPAQNLPQIPNPPRQRHRFPAKA